MKRKNKSISSFIFILILIIISIILYYFLKYYDTIDVNFKTDFIKKNLINNQIKDPGKNHVILTKDYTYLNYDNNMFLRLKNETNISKNKTINSILLRKNYEEIVNELNYIFPEKLEGYKLELDYRNEKAIEIPLLDIKGKKYINTYFVAEIFENNYYKIEIDKSKNKIIDILNANGIGGSAGAAGKKILNEFGYKYTAANYEEISRYSYIINNSLSKKELEDLVLFLDEKYVKIKKESSISTIADAVIIIGRENGFLTQIVIQTNNVLDTEIYPLIQKSYKNTKRIKIKNKIEEKSIEYNPEDYFIALKISKVIGIENMVENLKLKNRININLNK